MATLKVVRQALAALRSAEEARVLALRHLAFIPINEPPSFIFDEDIAHALRVHKSKLERSHGYRGHAIGWKSRKGSIDAKPTIVVFVRKKLTRAQLRRASRPPVPRALSTRAGRKLGTDVVEFGPGQKEGVFPGASIGPNPGTLACFAWNASAQFVGLTAGHVARGSTAFVSPADGSEQFGFLDSMSLSPVDGASIILSTNSSQILPDGSHMTGARRLTELDVGQPIYVYGAQTGRWSPGQLLYLAPWIAGWNVADGLVYTSPTRPGDSGGPVIDQHGYLIGIHLGRGTYRSSDVAIAQSIGRVASDLQVTPTFGEYNVR